MLTRNACVSGPFADSVDVSLRPIAQGSNDITQSERPPAVPVVPEVLTAEQLQASTRPSCPGLHPAARSPPWMAKDPPRRPWRRCNARLAA